MRFVLLGLLLITLSCRRPSKQFSAMLTPTNKPELSDYTQYLKAGDELVAIGNEPSWVLTLNPSKGTMRFKSMTGDSISIPLPDRQTDPNGFLRYQAPLDNGRINVIFRPDSCVDTMSEQRFDYRVEADVRGKNYMGCGVSLRQLALLNDIWVLTTFRGQSITASSAGDEVPRLEIQLTEGHADGTTGCNRFKGSVKVDTHQILFGPLATTRMACMGEAGVLESKFLAEMSMPFSYKIGEGKLTLLRNNQPVMVFKKVD